MAKFFRVHERDVMSFNDPGQPVYDMLDDLAWNMREYSRAYAPVKTGKLRSRIAKLKPSRVGPYGLEAGVAVNLKYAMFVHDGTTGPIHANGFVTGKNGETRRKKMKFMSGKGASGGRMLYKEEVRGQRANPFLLKGFETGMASFRAGKMGR